MYSPHPQPRFLALPTLFSFYIHLLISLDTTTCRGNQNRLRMSAKPIKLSKARAAAGQAVPTRPLFVFYVNRRKTAISQVMETQVWHAVADALKAKGPSDGPPKVAYISKKWDRYIAQCSLGRKYSSVAVPLVYSDM
jgi:hypothetical protein